MTTKQNVGIALVFLAIILVLLYLLGDAFRAQVWELFFYWVGLIVVVIIWLAGPLFLGYVSRYHMLKALDKKGTPPAIERNKWDSIYCLVISATIALVWLFLIPELAKHSGVKIVLISLGENNWDGRFTDDARPIWWGLFALVTAASGYIVGRDDRRLKNTIDD